MAETVQQIDPLPSWEVYWSILTTDQHYTSIINNSGTAASHHTIREATKTTTSQVTLGVLDLGALTPAVHNQ